MKFHFGSHHHHSNHGGGGRSLDGVVVPTDRRSGYTTAGEKTLISDTGLANTTSPPSVSALALDASRSACQSPSSSPGGSARMAFFHTPSVVASRYFGSPGGEHATNGGADQPNKNGSPKTKRALHLLDHHDPECPISHPDPHSRPRARQFFRLGRHRSKAGVDGGGDGVADRAVSPCCGLTSDSSDDDDHELGGSERTRRTARRPRGRSNSVGGLLAKANVDSSDDELGGSERARRPRRGIARLRKPRLRRHSVEGPAAAPKTALTNAVRELPALESPSIESTGSFDAMDYAGTADVSAGSITTPGAPHSGSLSRSMPELPSESCRHVTFASVHIREYSTILGDHPCCPSGPPLSLGWDLKSENSMEFEEYEKEREPTRAKNKEHLRLGGDVRRGIIRGLMVTSPPMDTAASIPHKSGEAGQLGASSEKGADDHHDHPEGHATALYSARELCRAERRLSREREGLNSRSHRRRNNSFFRPVTSEEGGAGGIVIASSAVKEDTNPEEKKEEVGQALPAKEEVDSSTQTHKAATELGIPP